MNNLKLITTEQRKEILPINPIPSRIVTIRLKEPQIRVEGDVDDEIVKQRF